MQWLSHSTTPIRLSCLGIFINGLETHAPLVFQQFGEVKIMF
jgi:hypothetical protein